MRIEFITQDDPLYILPFFEEFFRHYGPDFEIAQISACRVMGKRSRKRLLQELTTLYTVPGFLKLAGRSVLARALGKLPRDRSSARFHSLAQLSAAFGIPYELIGDPNTPDFLSRLRARRPDLIVSVACPHILKADFLAIPPCGCLNIHQAPLPRYKGMMPTFWQMYHGEKEVGVTVHFMAAKVDEGAAVLQESLPIQPEETLDRLIQRSKRHGAHVMAKALRKIAAGAPETTALDQTLSSYFTLPTAEEIGEFYRRGNRAI